MKKNRGSFMTVILLFAIVVIFSVTTYFCLDIFDIVDVPEKYSIAKLFGTTIKETLPGKVIEDIIPEDVIDDNSIVVILNERENPTFQTTAPAYNNEQETNNDQVFDYGRFYYNQLNEYSKIMYDKLHENKDRLKTGRYTADFGTTFDDLLHEESGSEVLSNSFQYAVNALTFDNPDIFYIDITKMYLLTEVTTTIFKKTYRVAIGNNGDESYLSSEFSTEAIVNLAISKIETQRDNIKNQILSNSNETKIRTVHNYLVDNVEYDSSISMPNIYNIYGTLVSKISVCEGYSRAFKYLLDNLEIPSIIVCGMATNSNGETENHAWNYVLLDEKWYAVDTTWDDPIIIGYGVVTDNIKYAYYLKGSDNFFKDHVEDGNIVGDSSFKYPALSYYDY